MFETCNLRQKKSVVKTTYYKNALYLPIYSNLKSIKNVGSFIYSRNLALARWHLKCVCWVVELLFDCDFYFLLRDLIFWTREIILLGDFIVSICKNFELIGNFLYCKIKQVLSLKFMLNVLFHMHCWGIIYIGKRKLKSLTRTCIIIMFFLR